MQDFAPPPEYASSPERQSVAAAECGVMAGVVKIKVDQVETVATEDEPEPEEQQDISTLQVLKEDAHQQEDCHQDPVYIPGLPPLQQKVKRKRKKKPRVKGDSVPSKIQSRTSSESEIKEIEMKVEDKDDFEEIMNFTVEENVNEIKLTDDLTNSLLNPPTEDDEMESSDIAKEILNLVDTDLSSTRHIKNEPDQDSTSFPHDDEMKIMETEIEIKPTETSNITKQVQKKNLQNIKKKTKKKKPSKPNPKTNDTSTPAPTSVEVPDEYQDSQESTIEVTEESKDGDGEEGSGPALHVLESVIEKTLEVCTTPDLDVVPVDKNCLEAKNPEDSYSLKSTEECKPHEENSQEDICTPPNHVQEVGSKTRKRRRRRKDSHHGKREKKAPQVQRVLVVDDEVT